MANSHNQKHITKNYPKLSKRKRKDASSWSLLRAIYLSFIYLNFAHTYPHMSKEGFGAGLTPTPGPIWGCRS